jgi:hypothetical protein
MTQMVYPVHADKDGDGTADNVKSLIGGLCALSGYNNKEFYQDSL